MPRGVYDRSKMKNPNGSGQHADAAATSATTPPARLWVRVYEIDGGDMPFEHRLYTLFREIRLRLENTPKHMAVVFVMAGPATLAEALRDLPGLFEDRLGLNWIELAAQTDGDEALLFVRRGKGWKSVYTSPVGYSDDES